MPHTSGGDSCFAIDGVVPAIVTPFVNNENLDVDYESLSRILKFQKQSGISWVLILGSTAEPHVLTNSEWEAIARFCVEECHSIGLKCIIGTGTNCTATSLAKTQFAADINADAVMLTCPYYNKPSPRMLINHFNIICQRFAKMPVVIYNIPGRTGTDISVDTAKQIAEQNPNVIGYKEATENIEKYKELKQALPIRVSMYTGEDAKLVQAMQEADFHGVMTVVGNCIPSHLLDIHRLCSEQRYQDANDKMKAISGLIQVLFSEPNPVPVKAAMAHITGCSDAMRLPLMPALPETVASISRELSKLNL